MGCSSTNAHTPTAPSPAPSELPPVTVHLSQRAPIQPVSAIASNLNSTPIRNEESITTTRHHKAPGLAADSNQISEAECLTWSSRGQLHCEDPIDESKCCLSPTSGRAALCSDAEQQSVDSEEEERLSGGTARPLYVPRLSLIFDPDDEASAREAQTAAHEPNAIHEIQMALMGEHSTGTLVLADSNSNLKAGLKRDEDGWDLRSMDSVGFAGELSKPDAGKSFDGGQS